MTEPVGQSPETLTASLELLAAALCHDAQVEGYDHGSNPTLVSFQPPYCPRHLGIAADARRSLATVRPPGARDEWNHHSAASLATEKRVVRPPGDEAGLRAALERIARSSRTQDGACVWCGNASLATWHAGDCPKEIARAALAAEPDREEPGLDVERLIRAMDRAMSAVDDEWTIPEFADITATEYARRANPDTGS